MNNDGNESKSIISKLGFFKRAFIFYKNLFTHKQTPLKAKFVMVVGFAYLVFPLDFIADFVPLMGQLDDLFIVTMMLRFAEYLTPEEVKAECRVTVEE